MSMRIGLLGVVICLLAVSCGGQDQVGSESLLNFEDQTSQRLGGATPSPTPDPAAGATSAAPTQPKPAAIATTPAPTAKPDQGPSRFVIGINGDNASTTAFDPSVAGVFVGMVVQWVNRDSVVRSVAADNGAFASPDIPPGGSFSWTPTKPGRVNYHDGTRPYAVGSLEVSE